MSVTLVEGDLPTELLSAIRQSGRVAVDTETSGLNWAQDRLQLCQLFTQSTGPILIRRVERRPARLAELFGDTIVTKVFHFAPFDLKFLEAQCGLRTTPVACTKAASRLIDPRLPSAEHSLKALLSRYLGIAITKGPVRTSDWGAATLSDEQISYAAADVSHLLDLYDALETRLRDNGLSQLFAQVCAYIPVDAHLSVAGYPNPLAY